MITLNANGPMRTDCTCSYIVTMDKPYTVREFISDVLTNRNDEWGYIGIKDGHPLLSESGSTLGKPYCEYSHGVLTTGLPDDILDKKIISASSSGGYTRMDYILDLSEKPNLKEQGSEKKDEDRILDRAIRHFGDAESIAHLSGYRKTINTGASFAYIKILGDEKDICDDTGIVDLRTIDGNPSYILLEDKVSDRNMDFEINIDIKTNVRISDRQSLSLRGSLLADNWEQVFMDVEHKIFLMLQGESECNEDPDATAACSDALKQLHKRSAKKLILNTLASASKAIMLEAGRAMDVVREYLDAIDVLDPPDEQK